MGSWGRSVLKKSTQVRVSISTWSMSRHGPLPADQTVVSASALSNAAPTVPADGSAPASISRSVSATDVYCDPASE